MGRGARGPGIQRLVLTVNVLVLLVPMFAVMLFRVYETHLIRQTERRLIAESVLVGEAWRGQILEIEGIPPEHAPDITPSWAIVPDVFPIEPTLDLGEPEQLADAWTRRSGPPPHAPRQVDFCAERATAAWRAGAAISPMLNRAKRINLSGVRVIEARGCVVASTGEDVGLAMDLIPEVSAALRGDYAAIARPRQTDNPSPPLGGISRRGRLRVFTATPVFAAGKVIGVVRMSRTSLDPVEALWRQRRTLALALVGSLLLTLGVSWFFARVITAPVRAITGAALAIAGGRPRRPLPKGLVPAEIRTLSAALDEMTAQLKARADYIAEFVGNISHELKTPLASVRGATELLRESWPDMSDAQRDRFLSNIDAATHRMTRQVSRLLQLARIEHTREAAEPIPLQAWFTGFVQRRAADGEIDLQLRELPETMSIPPEHLESVVGNLVDNALRHGAGHPVTLSAHGAGEGQIQIEVRDHGPGISEGNRKRIFDRFFTTARDEGGTGLGLAIVQAVARSRGGMVDFETGPEGTTFRVVLTTGPSAQSC